MREKDLRPGTDQVLRNSDDPWLYRVLDIAPKGETYQVENAAGHVVATGRYACVVLRAVSADHGYLDPEIIQAVTMEDFLAGVELAETLRWATLDSLAGLVEATEDELHQLLEMHANGLCASIEHGIGAMADQWEKTLPLIKELSYRRMWHDALGYDSWEEFIPQRFGAVLSRWRDIGALEQRVLELTTGEDAMSNRMAAVVAGTSEWTVRQIRKDAGVVSGPTRGKDDKTRKPRTPSAAKPVPVTPAEPASPPPGPDADGTQEPTGDRPGAPEPPPSEPVILTDEELAFRIQESLSYELVELGRALRFPGRQDADTDWDESITKDWPGAMARCWPTEPAEVKVDGEVIGTLTFTPAKAPESAEKFNLVEMERSGQQVTDTSRTSRHGTAEVATEPVIKTTVVNMKGHATDAEFMAGLASGQVVYVGHKQSRGGWNLDESALANPWHSDKELTQKQKVQKYREYIMTKPELLELVPGLRGRMLGCWCAPKPCHADVLAELADASAE